MMFMRVLLAFGKIHAEGEHSSQLRTVVVSQQASRPIAWRETMKTIVACVLGLAAFAISFASGGSPVHADALETGSSALPIVALDPDTNVLGALDQLHCVLYSDGADTCVVNEPLEVFDQQSTAVSEIDTSGTEPAPAVRFVDAIPAVVVQTATVAAPGFDARE